MASRRQKRTIDTSLDQGGRSMVSKHKAALLSVNGPFGAEIDSLALFVRRGYGHGGGDRDWAGDYGRAHARRSGTRAFRRLDGKGRTPTPVAGSGEMARTTPAA